MTNERILLTSKRCGACTEAKKLLKKENVEFREISVDNPEGDKLADKIGVEYLPTMLVKKHDKWQVEDSIDKWFS